MSVSRTIYAIKEPDEEYKKMAIAYRACEDAGIDAPSEVEKYFDYEAPGVGQAIDLGDVDMKGYSDDHEAIERGYDDCRNTTDIHLKDLPEGTYMVRIVISS